MLIFGGVFFFFFLEGGCPAFLPAQTAAQLRHCGPSFLSLLFLPYMSLCSLLDRPIRQRSHQQPPVWSWLTLVPAAPGRTDLRRARAVKSTRARTRIHSRKKNKQQLFLCLNTTKYTALELECIHIYIYICIYICVCVKARPRLPSS